MTVTTAKWTIADYHTMIEAGILADRAVELLHGEIVEMSPEGTLHAHLSTTSADYLRELLGKRVLIRAAKPITLHNSNSEPEPDIAIVAPLGDAYMEHHPYPENIFWVIEYADSSLAKDTEIKRQTYAAAGILEYWVINLRSMELIIYRDPLHGDYQSKLTLTTGNVTPLAFPDVAVAVDRLLKS
jgi:Uma2 family endonuclease